MYDQLDLGLSHVSLSEEPLERVGLLTCMDIVNTHIYDQICNDVM